MNKSLIDSWTKNTKFDEENLNENVFYNCKLEGFTKIAVYLNTISVNRSERLHLQQNLYYTIRNPEISVV